MKTFRLVRILLSEEGEKAFHPLRCKIEQRHSLLFGLVKWWGSPQFAPPHLFKDDTAACKYIWERYPKATIIDNYTGNNCK